MWDFLAVRKWGFPLQLYSLGPKVPPYATEHRTHENVQNQLNLLQMDCVFFKTSIGFILLKSFEFGLGFQL